MDNNIKDIKDEELIELYKSINDFIKYLENELTTQETIGENDD